MSLSSAKPSSVDGESVSSVDNSTKFSDEEAKARTEQLLEDLKRLPTQPSAAMRVLWALGDTDTSAGELARLVEADPALSTRIMQLANTAQYGLFRRVSSAAHAIMVVGFVSVRSLAVSSACGLFVDKRRSVPENYWSHSAATAAASSVIAEYTDAPISDAFSAGLLHDLGIALLFRQSPETYDTVVERAAELGSLCEAEREILGADHVWVAASVLEAWHFPAPFTQAIGGHHGDPASADPLTQAVIAGKALAEHLGFTMGYDPVRDPAEVLEAVGIDVSRMDGVLQRVALQVDELAHLFSW